MTFLLQIPCAVGHSDGDSDAYEIVAGDEDAVHDGNTFIIRDIPTPMLLSLPCSAAAFADGGSSRAQEAAICKLRAAEVTGMGIPGKVWDAGLALAGTSLS